jgi:hypothetical protein
MSQQRSGPVVSCLVSFLAVWVAASVVWAGDLSDHYGFGEMEILKLDWELGPPLAGDLNGNSLTDLVMYNNRKSRIELLLQRPQFDPQAVELAPEPARENINDIFGRETRWRFKRFHYPVHVKVTSLVLGDFNNDQRLDLAYYSAEGLHIVLQDRGHGAEKTSDEQVQDAPAPTLVDLSWEAPIRFDVRDGLRTPEALTAGDLNGDGLTDLLLLMQDGYCVLLQGPDGRLGQPVRYYSSSRALRQAEIGDVTGDGRNDLVLVTAEQEEHPLRIRLQNADGSLGPEGRYALPAPSALRLCRLGDCGKQVIASVSRQTGRFSIHALVHEDQQQSTASIHPLPPTDDAARRDIICADIDGDGLMDVIVSDPARGQFLVFPGQAGRGLGPAAVYPGLKDMRKLSAARLGDAPGETLVVLSVDEKLIAISRFEGGRLQFPQTVSVIGEPQVMELVDLDQDGQIDLAYVAKGPDPAGAYFLRTVLSVGRESARPGPSMQLTDIDSRPQDLLACDIDYDGNVDLIVVRSFDPLLLIRQTAPGVFEQQAQDQTHSGLVSNLGSSSLCLAPLGKDGRPALLVARGEFARSMYFDASKGWQVIDQYQAQDGRRQIRVAATLPGPDGGAPSIVGYDDVSGIVFFMDRQADGTYGSTREVNVGAARVRKILAGDFGAGGAPELVLCAERELVCLRTNAPWELRQIAGFEPNIEGGRYGHFTVADINGDGVPNVVLCEPGRRHVHILSFDGDARLTDAYKFRAFEEHPHAADRQTTRGGGGGDPRHVLVEDFTGDGRNDLLLLVHDRLILYPQD